MVDSRIWKAGYCSSAKVLPFPDTAIIAQISYSAMRIIHYVVSARFVQTACAKPRKKHYRTFFAYRSATVVFRCRGIRRL